MANYQVLFNGKWVETARIEAVRDNLARELGLNEHKAMQLFSGRTVVIRSQLEQHEARAWQDRFAQLGAICRIKNQPPAQPPSDVRDGVRTKAAEPRDTLREITAAQVECPRCAYTQLEASFCVRCGIDLDAAARRRRKEDLMIEKKLRELRAGGARRDPSPAHAPRRAKLDRPASPGRDLDHANVHDIQAPRKSKKGLLNWLKRS